MEFDKFLGFVFFVVMALCGFWGIKFLALTVPGWLQGWFLMKAKERKHGEDLSHGRKTMSEIEGYEVIYKK